MRSLRLKEVPEHWKAPHGPYRQAPADYGSEWWLVTPFSAPKPWLFADRKPEADKFPEGFLKVFGPRPKWQDYRGNKGSLLAFQAAVVQWEQELKFFKLVGQPEWAKPEQIAEAEEVLAAWLLGSPTFYEGQLGWMGRFLESEITDYDSSAWQIINYPHHVVSQYQITLYRVHGIKPPKWHPFVPPVIFMSEKEAEKEVARLSRRAS